MSKSQTFTAQWNPAWRGGHVKIFRDGKYIKHVPISQTQGEMLIDANEAIGTQWLIDNCMDLARGDVISHTGKPPWRFGMPDRDDG